MLQQPPAKLKKMRRPNCGVSKANIPLGGDIYKSTINLVSFVPLANFFQAQNTVADTNTLMCIPISDSPLFLHKLITNSLLNRH